MSQLNIAIDAKDAATVLTVTGPLDSNTSTQFNGVIMHLIAEGKHQVVVDLGGLSMLTSAGIGELAGAFNDIDDQGGRLVLSAVPDQAVRALEQLFLLDMFELFPDAQAALGSF